MRSQSATVRVTYVYDGAGNRTVQWPLVGTRTTYTYDAANQLNLSVQGAMRSTYSYDGAGNRAVRVVGATRITYIPRGG